MEELRLGGLEPERALHDDPVEDDAEELADLVRRDVGPQAASGLPVLDPGAAPLAGVLRSDRLPALAKVRVATKPAPAC